MIKPVATPPEPLPAIAPSPGAHEGPHTVEACAADYRAGAQERAAVDDAARSEDAVRAAEGG